MKAQRGSTGTIQNLSILRISYTLLVFLTHLLFCLLIKV